MVLNARILTIVLMSTLGGAWAVNVGKSSCDTAKYTNLRSQWSSAEDPCQKKMSFELWALMKAEGSADDADAKHVRAECIKGVNGPLRLELLTPEDWDSTLVKETCDGTIAGETKNAALFLCNDASDLEVFCADEAITGVSQVVSRTAHKSSRRSHSRRLQETTSEAGVAHKVAELVAGLEALGCERTKGEDQTLCIMSDSYNVNGGVPGLVASGDLPASVDIVKEGALVDEGGFPTELWDEGSAMMEIVFDIAPGANFKFNTAFDGLQAFADDVLTLASDEACDVIVDDVGDFSEPGFRDGVLSEAVDTVSDDGTLYFGAAGNDGTAGRFTSNFECFNLMDGFTHEDCDNGIAAHVFDSDATGESRYLLLLPTCAETVILSWDEDAATSRDIALVGWFPDASGDLLYEVFDSYTTGVASEFLSFDECDTDLEEIYISIIQLDSPIVDVDMMMLVEQARPDDFVGGAIYGHLCATKSISVAAMDWYAATGAGGAFNDPETASVADYSSRGPCTIDSGDGIENRLKPVITAATSMTTSTVGFERFDGTSAAAPAASAIATIIRAACSPKKLVTFTDIFEMMTNYDYTIDVTSDADGVAETWGREAGHSLISADQMLLWVAANCQETCPGAVVSPVPAPMETPSPVPAPIEAPTPAMDKDPILHGLQGQTIKWVGAEGGWYSMYVDKESGLQVNVRPTGPLPEDFPERQYLTGIAVMSGGHSLVIEVKDPYSIATDGCPDGVSPCLTDGGLRIAVDGKESSDLLAVTQDELVADGIYLSATNLPAECREFGGTKAWGIMYSEMLQRERQLATQTFEEWVVSSLSNAAAPEWCALYVSTRGLTHVQSKQSMLKIVTPHAVVRFGIGVNHRRGGKIDRHGRELPELDFWQGAVGLEGVSHVSEQISGMLGETARPVVDDNGHEIMEGLEALRGSIEDYRVLSAEGTDFPLLHVENA